MIIFNKNIKSPGGLRASRGGQLLLEVLFVIAVSGAILGVGSSLLLAGLRSTQISVERDVALGLMDETFEAVRAAAFESWKTVDDLSVGSGNPYFPELDADTGYPYKWIDHKTGAPWGSGSVTAVSALSPRDVWVGAGGSLYKWDGESWQNLTLTTTFSVVNDIATVSDTEVWAVGDAGKVFKWNGVSWASHAGGWAAVNITAVSASNSSNVWIVGASGTVYKYDGTLWTIHAGGWGVTNLNGVSALSNQAWIVGASGTVYRYSGTSWASHAGGWGSTAMNDVSFSSTSNVWIAGASGHVWKYDGSSWTRRDGAGFWGTTSVSNIAAFDTDQIFLSSADELWNYAGVTWSQFSSDDTWGAVSISDIVDRFSTELFVVGSSGHVWGFKPAKWILTAVSGSNNQVALNGTTYARSFYVEAVSRDSSGDIVTSGGTEDPSTLKVTATVSWLDNSLSSSEYISRWSNAGCQQTQWSTSGNTSVHINCPTTDYDSQTNISFLSGNTSLAILLPLVNATATLTSTVFDTVRLNAAGLGPVYRFIHWNGNMANTGNTVRFQIAVSECPNAATNPPTCSPAGTWNFIGGVACDGSNWFSWTGISGAVSDSQEISCPNPNDLNDKRYFKYKVELSRDSLLGGTPRVDDVTITWSP